MFHHHASRSSWINPRPCPPSPPQPMSYPAPPRKKQQKQRTPTPGLRGLYPNKPPSPPLPPTPYRHGCRGRRTRACCLVAAVHLAIQNLMKVSILLGRSSPALPSLRVRGAIQGDLHRHKKAYRFLTSVAQPSMPSPLPPTSSPSSFMPFIPGVSHIQL